MKKRKLKNSSTKHIYGFNSVKSGNQFRVESANEFDACYHLEYLENISSIEAQPVGYQYPQFRRETRYTPDFKVIDDQGQEKLIEVKG